MYKKNKENNHFDSLTRGNLNKETKLKLKGTSLQDITNNAQIKKVPRVIVDEYSIFLKENKKLIIDYGNEVFEFNRSMEPYFMKRSLLLRHSITSKMRMKMVDWMIEVFQYFKSDSATLFLSVCIMDEYINKSSSVLCDENIHKIGIASMFIASKFEEVFPIRMKNVIKKISFDSYDEYIINTDLRSKTWRFKCLRLLAFLVLFLFQLMTSSRPFSMTS